ncbi:MAG TPA: septum site-determining protein MinC [Herpetosiphonaceae bacterium]
MSTPIAIKGNKDGLRLMLAEDTGWDELLAAVRSQLERGTDFFHGAELTIDIGDRPLQEEQLAELLSLMREHGLQPSALATSSREGRSAGRGVGLMTRPANRQPSVVPREKEPESALLVMRTLRSGQVLRHPSHITIIGDVNPGAEVVAGGSVLVWGRLRGTVHAGALGDQSAVVCALELMPSLLRIADLMSRPPDQRPNGPETARIQDEQIVVEQWEGIKPRPA